MTIIIAAAIMFQLTGTNPNRINSKVESSGVI